MSTDKKKPVSLTKVTTPKFRVSFPQVFKAKGFDGGEEKFSVTMLFPKTTDLTPLKKAIQAVLVDKLGPDKTKWPKNLKNPIRDGAEKPDLEGYEDCHFVAARSKDRPGLVDQQLQPILAEGEFYAGCYARATINAFYFDRAGNRGVAFGLNNLQKLGDGESFNGRKRAEMDFDAVEDSSEDAGNYGTTTEEESWMS